MKTILTILILTLIIQLNFSQSRKDAEKDRELIKAKNIKAITYLSDEEGKIVTYYDKTGKPTAKQKFVGEGIKLYESKYDYDNNGNLIKEESFYTSGGSSFTIYEYDERGNVTKESFQEGMFVIYKYDENNFVISREDYDEFNVLLNKTEYRYRDDGLLKIERTEYMRNEEKSIAEHNYDNSGNKIETLYHSVTKDWKSKGVHFIEKYFYDINNNLIRVSKEGTKEWGMDGVDEITYEFYE